MLVASVLTRIYRPKAQTISRDHALHHECSNCQHQTLVTCVPLSTKHFSSVQWSLHKFYIRYLFKLHVGFGADPNVALEAPKGTMSFERGLARTLL